MALRTKPKQRLIRTSNIKAVQASKSPQRARAVKPGKSGGSPQPGGGGGSSLRYGGGTTQTASSQKQPKPKKD